MLLFENSIFPFYVALWSKIKRNVMGVWQQIAQYLFLKKKDKDEAPGSLIKFMHGINRISILLFLFAIIVTIRIYVSILWYAEMGAMAWRNSTVNAFYTNNAWHFIKRQ